MRIKSSATYILLLVFVCFTAGAISVILKPEQVLQDLFASATRTPTTKEEIIEPAPQASLDEERITILVLGVDHIADPEGKLLAVWLLTFTPGDPGLHLLGLPLDLPVVEGGPTLAQAFNLWQPPEYGARFIQQLGAFAPAPIYGWVALDEHGFATLLDYFAGVDLDDQHLAGSSVIGSLRLTYGNPQASLRLQAQVLEGLRSRVGLLGSTPELTPLTALSPIHAYTSPSPPELATMAIPLLPLDPVMISIRIWPLMEGE